MANDEPVSEDPDESVADETSTEPTDEVVPEVLPTTTQYPEGWHLVEAGTWQISVAPDGLLMLPRHLHPTEVADFVEAALAAADVGHEVIKANDALTTPAPAVEALGTSTFVQHTSEEPAGVKMMVRQRTGPAHQSAMGRPRHDPRQATPEPPPAPKAPGARRGRQ